MYGNRKEYHCTTQTQYSFDATVCEISHIKAVNVEKTFDRRDICCCEQMEDKVRKEGFLGITRPEIIIEKTIVLEEFIRFGCDIFLWFQGHKKAHVQCNCCWAHTVSPVTEVLVGLLKWISYETYINRTRTAPMHLFAEVSWQVKMSKSGNITGMTIIRTLATLSFGVLQILVWAPAQRQRVGRILDFQSSCQGSFLNQSRSVVVL